MSITLRGRWTARRTATLERYRKVKTVRFAHVVAKSGQPEPYTLWGLPEADREFQSALKQRRVMTVHQETVGARKDYGEVGFTGDRSATLLLFPKSLAAFEGQRVIGVKYDLLAAERAEAPVAAQKTEPKRKVLPVLPETPKAKGKNSKPAPEKRIAPEKLELRIFNPAEDLPERPNPAREERKDSSPEKWKRFEREVARAAKQLKAGKAVAAYETLESALDSVRE